MISIGDIQGHWQRHWIKAPGFEDDTTRVHWMQAGYDYADVRIPLKRPAIEGAKCLADLSAAQLRDLAQAEGFAGQVTLDGDNCTWHRDINWHGAPEGADIGAISFNDAGQMIETGVHEDYTELWEQRATAKGRAWRFSNAPYSGVLVVAGSDAVIGIGKTSKPASKPMLEALERGEKPAALFDGFHALCRAQDGQIIATLATNPFVEGQTIAQLGKAGLIWHRTDFDGAMTDVDMPFETLPA